MATGILLVALHYGDAAPDEFDDWYDTEHMAERVDCPGFRSTLRWRDRANPSVSIGGYDLDSIDVLTSPSYLALRGDNLSPWSRRLMARYRRIYRFEGSEAYPGDQIADPDAEILLALALECDPETEREYVRWHDDIVAPDLLSLSGVVNVRRFRSAHQANEYMTLCQLQSANELAAAEECLSAGIDRFGQVRLQLAADKYRRQP